MIRERSNILVPVDFKEPSIKAVKYAKNLAIKVKAEITLLYVLETPGLLSEFFASGDHLVKLTNKVKDQLQDLVSSITREGSKIKVVSRVERGKAYEKILQVAEEIQARSIILGENHQGADAVQQLGSTVYHVTLNSPVPVLTLKGDAEKMNNRIVVPLDLTQQTRNQLFSAIAYGINYGAKIYLVSALIGGISMKQSRIYNKLHQAKKLLEENGVECEIKLFERSEVPPYIRVLQFAEEIDAGMILVMTHREGYTYDNYIGAFAHHIINHSKVPVLSLTSSAFEVNATRMVKNVVDPVGILSKL